MGKISVNAFLREYGIAAKQKGSAMETFIKKHIVTDYIDFLTKSVYCEKIIDVTCYIKDGERKIVKINSANRYLFYIMRMIELYTDIELNQERIWEDYDKLNKAGAIGVIMAAIPKSEQSEFSTILNMKLDDFRDNVYSLEAIAYNFKESLSLSEEVINSVIEDLKKQVETAE